MTQTATIDQLATLFARETAITDSTYLDALRKRWEESAIQAGLFPLAGLVNVSELPKKFSIHPLEYWQVERVKVDELSRFAAPREALEKLSRVHEAGMPVKWLLWAEQFVTPPEIQYRQETVYVTKKVYQPRTYDPALIALLKGSDNVGIPYLVHCWLHNK